MKKSVAKKAPRAGKVRNLEQSRKEILDVAFVEVFHHGFQGVSVDDIVMKTSLTKGAFYHHFPTKLDLGYALVDDVVKPTIIGRWITPLSQYPNPLKGILEQTKQLLGGLDPSELKLGCPLNNLVQEMTPVDKGFQKRLQATLTLWIAELEVHLKRGKKLGFVRKDVNTREVAHFVVMTIEGMAGLLKGLDDPALFAVLFASFKTYLQSLEA
ncbi:MAG: TetR/AcrR family transcriptional regulator [Gemmatimonadota bacterium]|nr:TetR/AcrR family transcriptional regulator [Gemmatimonadota bacterium]